jgi:RNA methyltransferase, TrmH family
MATGTPARTRTISSPTNSLLKVFRKALAEGVTREGWLAVEGPHLLEEALASGERMVAFPPFDKLKAVSAVERPRRESTSPSGQEAAAPKVIVRSAVVAKSAAHKYAALLARLPEEAEVVEIPDKLFARVSATQTPQGLAALVELAWHGLDALFASPQAFVVVACGVQEPGNIGTIIRSTHALGGTAVLALKGTVSAFNPKAVRASAGAIFRLPVVQALEAQTLFDRMRRAGVRVIAADRRSPMALGEADLRGPVAVLIGREGAGLSEEVSREAAQHVSIPLRAGTDSVNAATAAGIFLYEAARQRGFRD